MAASFDTITVSVPAGDSLPVRVVVYDPATGEPLDLASFDRIEAALAPKSTDADPAAVATRSLGEGVAIVGSSAPGAIDIDWLPADTRQTPGLYSMQVRLGSGENVRRTARPSHVIRITPSPLT